MHLVKGVVVSKARAIPNIDGIFRICVIHNETDVIINPRKIVGCIQATGEIISPVDNPMFGEREIPELLSSIKYQQSV